MSAQLRRFPAGFWIPNPRGIVVRSSRQPPPVPRPCKATDAATMSAQLHNLGAAFRIPDLRGPVFRPDRQPPARHLDRFDDVVSLAVGRDHGALSGLLDGLMMEAVHRDPFPTQDLAKAGPWQDTHVVGRAPALAAREAPDRWVAIPGGPGSASDEFRHDAWSESGRARDARASQRDAQPLR